METLNCKAWAKRFGAFGLRVKSQGGTVMRTIGWDDKLEYRALSRTTTTKVQPSKR